MKANHGIARVGRVLQWQKLASYLVLGVCGASGVVWFFLLDAVHWSPTRVVLWWVLHGITGFLAIAAIGMALPHHVVATWRHHRNRWAGGLSLALLVALGLSALLLLYGPETAHDAGHWVHVVLGLLALVAFPWHVIRGRKSVGRPLRQPGTSR